MPACNCTTVIASSYIQASSFINSNSYHRGTFFAFTSTSVSSGNPNVILGGSGEFKRHRDSADNKRSLANRILEW